MLKYIFGNVFQPTQTLRHTFCIFVFVILTVSCAFAQLTIKPTTWNVIGLDSNKVTDGPNKFPVGVEVCNTSGAAINNVTGSFLWNPSNSSTKKMREAENSEI